MLFKDEFGCRERESSGSNREGTSLPGQPYSGFGCHGYLKRLVANDHGASSSPSVGSPTIEGSEESKDQAVQKNYRCLTSSNDLETMSDEIEELYYKK